MSTRSDSNDRAKALAKLREEFPEHHISKLPKETRNQIDERKANRNSAINCKICGGWHHKNAIHLDYVGHAALTDRLLDTDIEWSWEPVAFTQDGLPAFDHNNGLWIRLTVQGVSRLGYGAADGKNGGDAVKEIIGDALRNAAMRFGAALDLWHKGNLHMADDKPEGDGDGNAAGDASQHAEALIDDAQYAALVTLAEQTRAHASEFCRFYNIATVRDLPASQFEDARAKLMNKLQNNKLPKENAA